TLESCGCQSVPGYGAPPAPQGSLAEMLKGKLAQGCRCSRAAALHLLRRRLPIASWLPRYQPRKWLLGDVVAGGIMSLVLFALATGMAFALLTSVAPVYGLYTSFFPALLYMLFGTGHHVSTGKGTTRCTQAAVLRCGLGPSGCNVLPESYTYKSSPIPENTLIVMFTLHLGFLSTYLSEPVIKAFTSGAALHVVVSQLQSLLGLPVPRPDGCFAIFKTLASVVEALPLTNVAELLISGLCLAVLVPIKEINNRYRNRMRVPIPGEIIMVGGKPLTKAFPLLIEP
uniref:Solute carrier family 26 member 10 n=1 Tax=Varanus komodoensis TaxID=61221 RepID=A0A8D2J9C9_VARKO